MVRTPGQRRASSSTSASIAAKEPTLLPDTERAPSSHEPQVHSRSPGCATGTPTVLQRPATALSAATWKSGATTSVSPSASALRRVRSAASKVLSASREWPCMAMSALVGPALPPAAGASGASGSSDE